MSRRRTPAGIRLIAWALIEAPSSPPGDGKKIRTPKKSFKGERKNFCKKLRKELGAAFAFRKAFTFRNCASAGATGGDGNPLERENSFYYFRDRAGPEFQHVKDCNDRLG
ncbi:hypothetical protein V1291_004973 [Nitrobacteraceae bacterium AZCC 1564]